MKRFMKSAMAVALAFTLALGVGVIPAKAAGTKGLVAPVIIKDGWGSTSICHWCGPDCYSKDFSSYKLSGDVYVPKTIFTSKDTIIRVNAEISFWESATDTSFGLRNPLEKEILVGYDDQSKEYWFNGYDEKNQKDIPLSFVKSVTAVGDMVKIEIVDEPFDSKIYSNDWDEAANFFKPYTGTVPESGVDVNPEFRVAGDKDYSGKIAVTNVSLKIGDKTVTTDYEAKDPIGSGWGDGDLNYPDLKASTFNTTALSVAKASVNVKAKKSASVKVTTMFAGDKVKVSTSSKKVATASYKNGKVTIKGVKKGKATVSVKANGKTKKIKVTVK